MANHECVIEEDFVGDGFSVSCKCGWSDAYIVREDAERAIRDHYAADLGNRESEDLMSGYTKGPWCYQEVSDAYTHIVRGPNNYFICQLSQDTSGVSEANARLIAQAPAMLEALKQALDVMHHPIRSCVENNCPDCGELGSVKDAIRAVIAKAEPQP